MSHKNVLDSSKTALLVIDIQEAFRDVIVDFGDLAKKAAIAVQGFQVLGRPVLVTEQYPKGLGRTAAEIREVLPDDFEYIEKTAFSSCGASAVESKLKDAGATQIVVCGLETHVCVNQTTHDLLDLGFDVHILADCVDSRADVSRQIGLSKMISSGAVMSSVEMALFEMMRDATHEKFKEIQRLVK